MNTGLDRVILINKLGETNLGTEYIKTGEEKLQTRDTHDNITDIMYPWMYANGHMMEKVHMAGLNSPEKKSHSTINPLQHGTPRTAKREKHRLKISRIAKRFGLRTTRLIRMAKRAWFE